jgi:CRP-like cAMP-binding protein
LAKEFLASPGHAGRLRHVRKGETLFEKGGEVRQIFLILRGQIKIVATSPTNGKQTALLDTCGPQRWLVEGPLDGQYTYSHTAVATIDSDVVGFWRPTFEQMLMNNPPLAAIFIRGMAQNLKSIGDALDDQPW